MYKHWGTGQYWSTLQFSNRK